MSEQADEKNAVEGTGSAIETLVAADRRLHPEEYAKVDAIAEIIDPSAWPGEAWDGIGPEARRITWDHDVRVQYMRSIARCKARTILEYLGIVTRRTDWQAIFKEAGWLPSPPPASEV